MGQGENSIVSLPLGPEQYCIIATDALGNGWSKLFVTEQ